MRQKVYSKDEKVELIEKYYKLSEYFVNGMELRF